MNYDIGGDIFFFCNRESKRLRFDIRGSNFKIFALWFKQHVQWPYGYQIH